MHLTFPDDMWAKIEHDRRYPDGRIFRGIPPMSGIYVASWLRQFIRSHHDLPIYWPSPLWLWEHHEVSRTNAHYEPPPRPMTRHAIKLAPHAAELLRARSNADGAPAATILRRLVVQHFGRRPADPVRVTGGAHIMGPGCPTCY